MSIIEQIDSVKNKFLTDIESSFNIRELSDLRSKYLGRKGRVADLFKLLGGS